MNLKHLEHRLRLKQHELLSSLAGVGGEAFAAGDSAVGEGAPESLKEGTLGQTLAAEVQYALGRLGSDSFDKCISCGKPIETNRLKAIPWTLYCLEDQHKRDPRKSPAKQDPDEFTYSQSA